MIETQGSTDTLLLLYGANPPLDLLDTDDNSGEGLNAQIKVKKKKKKKIWENFFFFFFSVIWLLEFTTLLCGVKLTLSEDMELFVECKKIK